ncbi:MAG: hypothetical protein H7144_11670, partial [Burkholderiales bacterium]|nr:hypothetical protein [Phycisphaerae bacterium]
MSGSGTISNVSVGSLFGSFGFFNSSTTQSLIINNFSFNDAGGGGGGPVLTSDLQVSPQNISIAKLAQPAGSFVTTPVSVTNAGPNGTSYFISDNNSTTAITRLGGAGTLPIGPGTTQTSFGIRVATDTLGSFQSNHQAFNTSDTNDNNLTFDNRVYVEAYINRAPMPIAHLGNLGSYNPNGDLVAAVDQGAGAVKTKSISFENLYMGTFQAQQKWLSETVSNPAFTHTALFDPASPNPYGHGDYQLAANFRKATTFSFDTAGKLNGTYTATYSTVWGVGYAGGSNVQVDAPDTYTVNVQLSAVVTGNTSGAGSAPLTAGQSFANLNVSGNPSAGSLAPTEAKLLEGVTSGGTTVSMQIVTPSPTQLSAFGSIGGASDVLSLSGTGSDVFVLQMNYDPSALTVGQNEADLYLAWWNGLTWTNAVAGNTPNTIYAGS